MAARKNYPQEIVSWLIIDDIYLRMIRWCTGETRMKTTTMIRKTNIIINSLPTRMEEEITTRMVVATIWSTTRVYTTTTMRVRSTRIRRRAPTSSTRICAGDCSASSRSERPMRCSSSPHPRSKWARSRKRRRSSSRASAYNRLRPLTITTISHRPLRNVNSISLCWPKTMGRSARDRASLNSRWQARCSSKSRSYSYNSSSSCNRISKAHKTSGEVSQMKRECSRMRRWPRVTASLPARRFSCKAMGVRSGVGRATPFRASSIWKPRTTSRCRARSRWMTAQLRVSFWARPKPHRLRCKGTRHLTTTTIREALQRSNNKLLPKIRCLHLIPSNIRSWRLWAGAMSLDSMIPNRLLLSHRACQTTKCIRKKHS